VLGVVGAALAIPAAATSPAVAQAAVCSGLPATVVGAPGVRTLRGTSGDDVIVSGGAGSVRAGDGDDVVCATGGGTWSVSAGPGNDLVDTTAAAQRTFTTLGSGVDTFTGGRRVDDVEGGAGADQVHTGGGADNWTHGSGDTADLGAGNDTAQAVNTLPAGAIDAGPGMNTLVLSTCCDEPDVRPQWVVDNVAEEASVDGVTSFAWDNFRSFAFSVDDGLLDFVGSEAGERLRISHEFEFGIDLERADMGGGNDQVVLRGACCIGPMDGGAGTDWVRLVDYADERALSLEERIVVDLGTEFLSMGFGRTAVAGMENVEVADFTTAVLRGNDHSNAFVVGDSCLVRVEGAGGPDTLRTGKRTGCPSWSDSPRAVRADGGEGNDLLWGRVSNDRLVGGPGRDAVDGQRGRDACAAEIRAHCERRP
jgi:Ca2+-binding RTX toxin-like protein